MSPKAKILMIDDDESLRILFELVCKKRGNDAVTAAGSEDALKALAEHKFDVLLVDMKLMGESGVDALERIRAAGYHMPAVISSGAVQLPNKQTMQNLKIIGTNDKNYNNDVLFDLLNGTVS